MASCYDRFCRYRTQQTIKRWLIFLVIVLLVLATAVVLIVRFAVVPHVTANVEDARLDTFEFATTQGGGTTTSFFRYNISVALIVRNSNRAMTIKHTKPLVATFVFHDRRLHTVTVVDKKHKCRRGKTEVHLLHTGGDVPSFLLGAAAAEDFKKQNATGLFKMEVRLSGEITYHRILIAKKHKLNMSCPLRLQLAPPGPEVVVFHEVNINCSICLVPRNELNFFIFLLLSFGRVPDFV